MYIIKEKKFNYRIYIHWQLLFVTIKLILTYFKISHYFTKFSCKKERLKRLNVVLRDIPGCDVLSGFQIEI